VAKIVSRSSFGLRLAPLGLLPFVLMAGSALGQTGPSPVAPGDLSKPVFDTTTPVYDSVSSLDKAASAVVAEVEGRPITLGNVKDAIAALPPSMSQLPLSALYSGVLDKLIRQQALAIRAREKGLDEDPAVSRQIRAATDRILSEQYMQREISQQISEVMLLERYNRDIANRPGPEELRLRVILTDTEKEATALSVEIRGGADFVPVARRASKDNTAQAGGELGFLTREGMIPEIAAVAFTLPTGQLAVVRSEAGWFIVRVEERRNQPAPAFASVREQLRLTLMKERVIPLSTEAMHGLNIRSFNLDGSEIGSERPDVR